MLASDEHLAWRGVLTTRPSAFRTWLLLVPSRLVSRTGWEAPVAVRVGGQVTRAQRWCLRPMLGASVLTPTALTHLLFSQPRWVMVERDISPLPGTHQCKPRGDWHGGRTQGGSTEAAHPPYSAISAQSPGVPLSASPEADDICIW